ncbi:MAG TPA: ROK family protein, partial [Vitreimonas sp.]|nr:ROK family protein [Vitreimonas sp.]
YSEPTSVGAPSGAADAIVAAVQAAVASAGASPADVAAVGVGVPGRVEPLSGTVTLAVNLGWNGLPLGAELAARLGLPVALENDVRTAAAGLYERRVLGPVEDLAYLGIGTGISAGIVLSGRLHRGGRGMAGEIGHIVLDPDGPGCACGLRGCFEALAAGPAVARRAAERLAAGARSSLAELPEPTAGDVYQAAAEGDPLATAIAAETGSYVARAVHELVMAYDVEVVVLGGGVAGAGDAFLDPILRALDRLRDASLLAREVLRPGVVHLLPADAEAGTWGAVMLAARAATAAPAGASSALATKGGG